MNKQDVRRPLHNIGQDGRSKHIDQQNEIKEEAKEEKTNQEPDNRPVPTLQQLIEEGLKACQRRFEGKDSTPTFGECLKIMELAKEHGLLAQPNREIKVTWVEPESISSEE